MYPPQNSARSSKRRNNIFFNVIGFPVEHWIIKLQSSRDLLATPLTLLPFFLLCLESRNLYGILYVNQFADGRLHRQCGFAPTFIGHAQQTCTMLCGIQWKTSFAVLFTNGKRLNYPFEENKLTGLPKKAICCNNPASQQNPKK